MLELKRNKVKLFLIWQYRDLNCLISSENRNTLSATNFKIENSFTLADYSMQLHSTLVKLPT